MLPETKKAKNYQNYIFGSF